MNSRFSIAVHILTLLASQPEERLTSEMIAASVGTNPVVIRRQLALLRDAGLVESKGARGGGWTLARPPHAIRLSDIKAALGEEASFRMHKNAPHPKCVVGQNVRSVLKGVYEKVEAAVAQSLTGWTVQDVLSEVKRRRPPHSRTRYDSD